MSANSPLLDGQPIHFNEATSISESSLTNTKTPLALESQKLINWSPLNHVYSIISAYGGPSCILPTNSYFVLGTIKGALLIFNYKEFLQVILLPQTKDEIPSTVQTSLLNRFATSLHSKVMDIVMSYDGTHLAASYESGDVYLWNLNDTTNKQQQLLTEDNPVGNTNQRSLTPLSAILHITEHQGKEITGIDFLPNRHTGLVVSNVTGNVLYHNGHRTGFWNMTYSVKKLLIIPPNEVILNTKLNGDKLAILTNTKFGLISVQNSLQMIFEEKFESILTNNLTIPQNSMSWMSDNIAYSVKNKITVYLNFERPNKTKLIWNYTEPILLLQWFAPNLLGLLTVSHQLLIVNPMENFNIVMTIDLLIHDLLIPPNKHFRWYRNKLFLLTNYSFKVGKFVSWSSLLLKRVQKGDYIDALSLLNQFADKSFPIPTLLSLSINPEARKLQLKEPFNNLTFAALKFLLNNNKVDSIEGLISTALQLQVEWFPNESKEVILQFLDITWETILQQSKDITKDLQDVFLLTINKLIKSKTIQSLSPMLFQATLQKYPASLKTLILSLDKSSWDYDLLVHMCQKQHDVKTLIYIWNISFNDYLTPFIEMLKWIRDGSVTHSSIFGTIDCSADDNTGTKPDLIFGYISSCFNGLQYPTIFPIDSKIKIYLTKQDISYILFSGVDVTWPVGGKDKLKTLPTNGTGNRGQNDEPAFPYFKLLMIFNPSEFYKMLSEIVDDGFFNDEEMPNSEVDKNIQNSQLGVKITRQHVMDILLNIIKEEEITKHSLAKQLTIAFMGEFLAKYCKEIFVTNKELENITKKICDLPDELILKGKTIEELIIDLLNLYVPKDPEIFITQLKARNFKKSLFFYYKKNQKYLEMIQLFLSEDELKVMKEDSFQSVINAACRYMDKNSSDFIKIKSLVKDNFDKILKALQVGGSVDVIQGVDPTLHKAIMVSTAKDKLKLDYLESYFRINVDPKYQNQELKKYYIRLSCKLRNDQELTQWVKDIELDVSDSNNLIEELIKLKNYEALSEVHHKIGNYSQEITFITKCIHEWFKESDPDIDNLNRYVNTGIGSILSVHDQKESYWVKLVSCLMKEFCTHKDDSDKKIACNNILQRVFVRLILIERKNDDNLYEILAGILDDNEIIMTKSKNLKDLFVQIFVSYHLEEAISETLLKIIQDSSLGMVNHYQKGLKEGWTIHNSECEICGKKLWGVGLNPEIFHQWEDKQRGLASAPEELSDERMIVFKCCHGFHKKCLNNLGQHDDKYECLLCNINSNDN
ncbi:vacuolar protein sorting-associated protein 8 [Monosporozyma unispora]|nr:Vacuolar protein sorting-associated protein 8 [Kazachstania unispora]